MNELCAPETLGYRCIFSSDRVYRYVWSYEFGDATKRLMFAGLNPSRADERVLDNTVRKMIMWARDWGYGALDVVNAFAYRSTDPKKLYEVEDPVGPDNDRHILEVAARASLRLAGWGRHAKLLDRGAQMLELLKGFELCCMGVNQDGSPLHPLYTANAMRPVRWRGV
jgi:hypothetical protein